ncbi:MAG: hypothetical protein A2430_02095 [Candidatus Liptonbacteria bacterium RIFOXYC1_FULL_36_8]|uniref:Glycosyl transferase family 1 domain-containing protein n=2 Tax=Candidatus Liptoniibacteriota TaxID=1817909 RepID=A0A1G2CP80_9BACT|nr:MAG: hypothetical protein A2390_02825 [Candidatus Liptonbacteria bacterium RIFOXYB1_FULL_36_10]OGZ03521.1 MAG: hypothetical protein A2430_02095 [Candidatus Liptonbacteria bacterium RIFOXYC1_FULL_36_8]
MTEEEKELDSGIYRNDKKMTGENKKRKVIIFSTAYLPMVGGAEIAVKEITERLGGDFSTQGGFDFLIVTARLKRSLSRFERVGEVDVFRVGMGCFLDKYLLPFLGVLRVVLTVKGDSLEKPVIWAIMASFGGFGALFLKLLKPKWPFLLTLQEGDSEEYILKRVGVFRPVWKMIFWKADYAQVISSYLKNFAIKYGAKCPVEVVPNGASLRNFQLSRNNNQTNNRLQIQNELREKLGIKEDERVVLTVSRLVEKNGVDVLIEAINELKVNPSEIQDKFHGVNPSEIEKKFHGVNPSKIKRKFHGVKSKVKLLIVGDGQEREVLELKVKSLGLEEEVVFVGEVKPEEVVRYYEIADVFVRPSRSEGFGNVFIEAMAAGVSVVATDVGGIKDFLRNGENGLVCEVNNPEDVAKKIKKILDDKKLAQKLREGGEETARDYDWDIIAGKMKGILNGMTND